MEYKGSRILIVQSIEGAKWRRKVLGAYTASGISSSREKAERDAKSRIDKRIYYLDELKATSRVAKASQNPLHSAGQWNFSSHRVPASHGSHPRHFTATMSSVKSIQA